MRPKTIPRNEPRPFQLDEMFFSTTDRKGVIRSGNGVFVRVSGYAPDELFGQAHNIIRHPDMPRAAFRLVWRELGQSRPVAAYVKNLAKDGCYYWVLALITPQEDGFLSVRIKPSSPLLAKVEPLYAAMLAAEQAATERGQPPAAAMDAAEAVLGAALKAEGFADYAEFMWALVHAEMKSRAALLARRERVIPAGVDRALRAIEQAGEAACQGIDRLYVRLDELAGFSRQLTEKSTYVTNLTRDIRFVALSTSIKAAKLGDEGSSLGVIAQFLSDSSTRTAGDVQRLTERIGDITGELHAVIFNLAAARLEIEMALAFCRELMSGDGGSTVGNSRRQMITDLGRAFGAMMRRATGLLGSLGTHLAQLNAEAEDLRKTMLMLQVAQVCGMVETSRLQADRSVTAIFDEVREHVQKTSEQLAQLGEITLRFAQLIEDAPEIERDVGAAVRRMEEEVAGLQEAEACVAAAPAKPAPRPVAAVRIGAAVPA